MFKIEKSERRISIETGNAIYRWEGKQGGQLTELTLKDGASRRELISPDRPAPNLTLSISGKKYSVADFPATFTVQYEEAGYIIFSASSTIAKTFIFEQQYEVFRESVIFCEFRLAMLPKKEAIVSSAEMGFNLNLQKAKNLKVNYVSRDPYLKQDVTTTHVLANIKVANNRNEKINCKHLLAMTGLDAGWDNTKCYSHRIEFVLEDNSSLGGEMLAPTATISQEEKNRWVHIWKLCLNKTEALKEPFFYRNKWGLFIASARTEAGPTADPVRRNNVLGARVCHVMYPYIYGIRNWPWCSVPTRQTFYQDVQLAKENPPLKAVAEAASLGANVLLIHQFWMKNGGSNGEPMSNYRPQDPKWLKAFIAAAHKKGMRVLLYMRGIEQYSLYDEFFEKYLKRNFDGLYIDWAAPFAMGFAKSTPLHSSVYNYFMFTRALRKRVGEQGVLIGHSTLQSASSYACFDAAVTGEFSVLHSGLISTPEIAASYGGSACIGPHLIAGNSPDRAMFSGQRAAGFAAGLCWANHPFLEPGKSFTQCSAFAKPLWDMINSLSTDPVRVFNPSVEPVSFAKESHPSLYPVAYKDRKGNILITITNLSDAPVTGSIEINRTILGLKKSAVFHTLKIKKAATATVKGDVITVKNLKPYFFCGILSS